MDDTKTVLIIDDDATLRGLMAEMLTGAKFNVLTADNGVTGLDTALEKKPDCIVLDITMPQMSGFQMLKTLRAKGDWGAHVPVIFLSNIQPIGPEEFADIESTEPAHYFVKSDIKLEDLVAKIKDVLHV